MLSLAACKPVQGVLCRRWVISSLDGNVSAAPGAGSDIQLPASMELAVRWTPCMDGSSSTAHQNAVTEACDQALSNCVLLTAPQQEAQQTSSSRPNTLEPRMPRPEHVLCAAL